MQQAPVILNYLFTFDMVDSNTMLKVNCGHTTLDVPAVPEGLSFSMVVRTAGHQEFRHSSPKVIISTLTKNRGVEKYADDRCVRSVKNHIARPADLSGEVISDANRVNHFGDIPDFGNYEAGAN